MRCTVAFFSTTHSAPFESSARRPLFTMSSGSQDVVMMDVADSASGQTPAPKPQFQLFAAPKPVWVSPPPSPSDLESTWTSENSTQEKLVQFLARWPPSRTPSTYGPWIVGDRGGRKTTSAAPNLAGLAADFQSLLSGDNVTVDTLDQISKTNNVLVGKWMVFEESSKIDMLWGKILHHVCVERQKGLAKVSTWKEGERHVICVYVDDYTDREEVDSLRKALRTLGVKGKIGFKTDAYTHLNIYKDNPWKLRPSRYQE
ncbi:translation initiation factor eIF 4e-like domain-containing protein [Flammula alnicola]|nr:translation initiation factor eIF 4e-like domain-containing protein [Flammula alnicola]